LRPVESQLSIIVAPDVIRGLAAFGHRREKRSWIPDQVRDDEEVDRESITPNLRASAPLREPNFLRVFAPSRETKIVMQGETVDQLGSREGAKTRRVTLHLVAPDVIRGRGG
jgi:hypothetical protein